MPWWGCSSPKGELLALGSGGGGGSPKGGLSTAGPLLALGGGGARRKVGSPLHATSSSGGAGPQVFLGT